MREQERKELEKLADEIVETVVIGSGLDWIDERQFDEYRLAKYKDLNNDKVNHPSHYNKTKYECLDVVKELIKDMNGIEGALFFNVFKYLWRYPHKNGIEDLKKCEFYLKDLIAFNENI